MDDVKQIQKNSLLPKQRSLEEKQRHYTCWKKSNLSYKEYCRQHQLSPKTFSGWVKQFQETSGRKMEFVSVPLKRQETLENHSLEIKLPNGILCRFSQTWEKDQVIAIVRSLHAFDH
jgi:transposase-like protein